MTSVLREEDMRLDINLRGRFARGGDAPARVDVKVMLPDAGGLGERLGLLGPVDKPWSGLRLAGEMTAEAKAERSAGTWSGSASWQFHRGSVELPAFPLSVSGIEAGLRLRSLWPPETPEGQTLQFTSFASGALVLDGGEIVYQLRGPEVLAVEACSLLWCGGRLVFEPFDVNLSEPALDIRLAAQGVDLSRVFALQQTVSGEAQGTAHGTLRLVYRPGQAPQVEGFLESEGAGKGRLRVANPSTLTQHLDKSDPRIKDVERSLRDFRYDQLRMDVEVGSQELAQARLRLVGRSATDPRAPPVRLTVNFEAEMEDLLYIGNLLQRLGR
jgi:hypothetical protein